MSRVLSLALIGLVLCQGLAQLLDKRCHDPKTSENINFNHGATETAPWMASIYKNNQFICDGTLVHKCKLKINYIISSKKLCLY